MPVRLLLVGWGGGGNVNPLVALAQELSAQRARVEVLCGRGLSPRLEESGVQVRAETAGPLPTADDLLRALETSGPDAVVVDYMLTDALCAAEASGRPTVALVHTLYRSLLVDGAPHPMAMAGPVEALNTTRARLGLAPIGGYADLLAATVLIGVTTGAELDAPGPVPSHLRYLGPLVPDAPAGADWDPPEGRGPLVAVSMGTGYTVPDEAEVTQRILEALGRLEVRGLVNLPGYIDPSGWRAPANVTLAGLIPHQLTLSHASLLMTHAGLGSVTAALSHGLPMVCMPLGREQPENAAAVAGLGRGVVIPAEAGPEVIARAITEGLALGPSLPIPSDRARAARIVLDAVTNGSRAGQAGATQ